MPHNPLFKRNKDPTVTETPTESSASAAFESHHVHKVYDVIASHFSSTRYKPWPRVAQYLEDLAPGSFVADVGCGNGKYLGTNPKCRVLGSDMSANLIEICGSRGFESMICDNLELPYRSGCFDAVISIAVVHHFSTPEKRLAAVTELCRLLRVGGTCLIYCWALEQKGKGYTEQDLLIPWTFQKRFQKEGQDLSSEQSGGVEEENGDVVFQRFYHMFREGELEGLIAAVPGMRVRESVYDHENWTVVAVKEE